VARTQRERIHELRYSRNCPLPVAPKCGRGDGKGPPEEAALRDLVRTYLDVQRRLWPELARDETLPAPSDAVVARMADEFRRRFLSDGTPLAELPLRAVWRWLGAAYLRYSCDNSNPRSLDQQLRNTLERARRDGVFVPWTWVFADAAVTGTTAARRGYRAAKEAVEAADGPTVLFIDEIGRASRDAVEALRLGKLIEATGKRLVGASDGFDSDTPHAKLMLSIFAMLQEWFVDQLRAKVKRGMADAFERGKNLGPPAVGYKLVNAVDPESHKVFDADGAPIMAKAIDRKVAKKLAEAAELFAERRWSPDRVARWCNERRVGGKQNWDRGRVIKMLTRETYVGVEYYGMTYQQRDPETGGVTVKHRPKSEWKRREVPHLRIFSDGLRANIDSRLAECRRAYRPASAKRSGDPSRSTAYAKVLVRPVCGYCGNELWLGRAGRYASFCCLNGKDGKKGCRLRTYKSVRIVEEALLGHLKEAVLTPDFVREVLAGANAFLAQEAKRPREDTKPVRSEIKDVTAKRDRLVTAIELGGDVDAIVRKFRAHENRLEQLRERLRQMESRNQAPPLPMRAVDVEALLADLRGLLNRDVAEAAAVLRELTGPVVVTQVKEEGQRGATWMAKFAVNLVPVLAKLTGKASCPTTGTWESQRT
jgi:site-specific DNA recombinase